MKERICLRCNKSMKLCCLNCGDFKVTIRERYKEKNLKTLFGLGENFAQINAYVCLQCGHIELFMDKSNRS